MITTTRNANIKRHCVWSRKREFFVCGGNGWCILYTWTIHTHYICVLFEKKYTKNERKEVCVVGSSGVCLCLCVCVCRERERKKERKKEK